MNKYSIVVLLLLAIIVAGYFFVSGDKSSIPEDVVTELEAIEIREYEGEKLSSVVNDFGKYNFKGVQYIKEDEAELRITGLVENPITYSHRDVLDKFGPYKKVVTLDCVEGWSAKILWEGVLTRELLAEAKPLPEAKIVIFHAHDGYTTTFPVEYIMEGDIIMAYNMNGVSLLPERGFPYQLVAESKWGYKWIRWISEIEFSDDENFESTWGEMGYSEDGDLDEPFLDR